MAQHALGSLVDFDEDHPTTSGWRWPMLALWVPFFLMGLFPDLSYILLRRWGMVLTQNAMVNSPFLLYFSLIFFVVYFIYARCREAGISASEARAKGFTVFCYGIVGFFPFPVDALANLGNIYDRQTQIIVVALAGMKMLAWCYLWALILRYHFTAGIRAFAALPMLLPSVHREPMPHQDGLADREAETPSAVEAESRD